MLRLFVSQGSAVVRRRALLALCPNGDWRSERVQYYAEQSGPRAINDPAAVLTHVANGVMVALASAQPCLYNRSRWIGSDLAVDDLAIFEAVHKLLSTSYCRFAASFASGSLRRSLEALRLVCAKYDSAQMEIPALAPREDDMPGHSDAVGEAEGAVGGDEEGQRVAGATLPVVGGAQPSSSDDWIAQNAKDRKLALQFLRGNALGNLILARLLMEPLRVYLAAQFKLASGRWEQTERAKVAQALASGQTPRRLYRAQVVAGSEHNRQFLEQSGLLIKSPVLWDCMVPSFRTFEKRCLAFRCVSRMMCAFVRLLVARHQTFPLQLFRLLGEPELAPTFAAMSECLLDDWSLSLKRQFPGFEGCGFEQALHTVASAMPVDINHIEPLHASVRRHLFARSQHTHTLDQLTLSAQWVLQQKRSSAKPRRRDAAARGARGKRRRQKEASAPQGGGEEGASSRKRRFGGAWRAWVRRYTSGVKFGERDMKTLAAEYKEAKRANAAEYQDVAAVGAFATQAGRNAGATHGFGGAVWQLRRSHLRLDAIWKSLMAKAGAGDDVGSQALAVAAHSYASGGTVAEALSLVRVGARLEAQNLRRREEAMDSALQSFDRSTGPQVIADVRAAFPSLASLPMVAVPTPVGRHVEVLGASQEDVAQCVSWARDNPRPWSLGTRMDRYWEALHKPVVVPEGPSEGSAPHPSPCRVAGVCLCSEEGMALKARADKFVTFLAKVFPTASVGRRDLVEGFFVARLIGASAGAEANLANDDAFKEAWLHVGLMYLSPLCPHFLPMKLVAPLLEAEPNDNRVYLEVVGAPQMLYQAFAPFARSETLRVRFYRFESTDRPIGRFCPSPLPVLTMPAFEAPRKFWPRATWASGSAKGRGRPRGASPASDDEASSEEPPLPALATPPADASAEGDVSEVTLALVDDALRSYEEGVPDTIVPISCDTIGVGLAAEDAASVGDGAVGAVEEGPPLPPPPLQLPPAGPQRKRKTRGDALAVVVDGGLIQFFASNGNFQATCATHGGRCTLTRKGIGASSSSRSVAGRPLAMLVAWLAMGTACVDKEEHRDPESVGRLSGPDEHAWRLEVRQTLRALPEFDEMLEHENGGKADDTEPPRVM